MSHLFAGRAQMGSSLALHIVFASIGVGLLLLMLIADGLALRTGGNRVAAAPGPPEQRSTS